jgi:hypothetical protein
MGICQMSQDDLASNRNRVGPENMIVYGLGIVASLAGLSLARHSRTTVSLATGATLGLIILQCLLVSVRNVRLKGS